MGKSMIYSKAIILLINKRYIYFSCYDPLRKGGRLWEGLKLDKVGVLEFIWGGSKWALSSSYDEKVGKFYTQAIVGLSYWVGDSWAYCIYSIQS